MITINRPLSMALAHQPPCVSCSHLPGTPVHDLFASYVGMVVLYALLDLGRTALQVREQWHMDFWNAVHNGLQALEAFAKCFLFVIAWVGLVAVGFGSLVELSLRPVQVLVDGHVGRVEPLRAWSMGITILMTWHLAAKRAEVSGFVALFGLCEDA